MEAQESSLVSVVIPCYRQAHYLGEAIESVLGQSYGHHEVIVVDDGSPDNTAEVAARYPQVRYIRQDNQGLAGARNTGLGAARGDYIVFLDADDRLVCTALEIGLNYLQARPECVFVAGRPQFITADGTPIQMTHRPRIEKDHYLALIRHNYLLVGTLMYRRRVFDTVAGFNTTLPACEDYDFHLQVTRRFPVYCHDEIVMEYRRHNVNMSNNAGLILKHMMLVLRSQRKYIKGNKGHEKAYRDGVKIWQNHYGDLLAAEIKSHLQMSGGWKLAVRDGATLLRYHPLGFAKHLYKKFSGVVVSGKRNSVST